MEQLAIFGAPLALSVPEYVTPPPPSPPDPRCRLAAPPRRSRPFPSPLTAADASAVVPLGIARQRLRGVKSTRTMNYGPATVDERAQPVAAPRAELRRVTRREHDDGLRCEVVSGIGFSWRCTCGKRGKITGSRAAALAGKREHEAEHRVP